MKTVIKLAGLVGGVLVVAGLVLAGLGGPAVPFVAAQANPTAAPGDVVAQEGGIPNEADGLRPASSTGDAAWTVADQTYAGEYPEGFRFEIAANSDQGAITNARVVWTHAPGTNTRRTASATYDDETGRWVALWQSTSNPVPPWVLVRYRWELTDEAGNQYVTAEVDETYADASNSDRWHHLESEDGVVYWIDLPDEYGQRALDALAERREFYREAWGDLLPYRPRVILYGWTARPEYESLFNRPIIVGDTLLAGTTRADWGSTVQLAQLGSQPDSMGYGTVLHEVAHLYQEQFTRVIADWFIEGNAEFFSLARSDYRDYARSRLNSGDPLSFAGGFSTDGTNFRDGYWVSTTVWDYLVTTYGLDAHRQVWQLIQANVPRFEALEIVTGVSIQEFELGWRRWLGVDSLPPTVVPEPTAAFDPFALPTPSYGAAGS